jgi:predicted nucleic acid-binding protein
MTSMHLKHGTPLLVNRATIENAWRIQDKYQFSWWDYLILSAAQIQDCKYILSEDLQHEQAIDDVKIINPFLSDLSRISS